MKMSAAPHVPASSLICEICAICGFIGREELQELQDKGTQNSGVRIQELGKISRHPKIRNPLPLRERDKRK